MDSLRRNKMVEVKCLNCQKEFGTYPCKIREGRGKFCGKICFDQHQTGISHSPRTQFKKGMIPHNFKGWTFAQARANGQKYIEIYIPSHPYATKRGYVRKHRLVMEEHVKRYLNPDEIVDHIDGNTLNNNISNLRIMTKKEHDSLRHSYGASTPARL